MKKIVAALGTLSNQKISHVKKAFDELRVKHELKPFDVSSGISEQPMSQDETIQGAHNRAKNALQKCKDADLGIGLEAGLESKGDDLLLVCVCAIRTKDEKEFLGIGDKFKLPKEVADAIKNGKEFGQEIRKYKAKSNEENELVQTLIKRDKPFIQACNKALTLYLA